MNQPAPEKNSPYGSDNLRFRKAYIRERLAALKVEREALIADREEIDRQLSNGSAKPSSSQTQPET